MTTSALITLVLSQGIVTFFTVYFLWRVLRAKPHELQVGSDLEATDPKGGDKEAGDQSRWSL